MRRTAAAVALMLALASCTSGDEETETAGTTPGPAETATTSTTAETSDEEWLAAVRTAAVYPEIVESVETQGGRMVIQTTLGRHDDEPNQGQGATVCFAAQEAGWTESIEVLARSGGPLAATRDVPAGLTCMGAD